MASFRSGVSRDGHVQLMKMLSVPRAEERQETGLALKAPYNVFCRPSVSDYEEDGADGTDFVAYSTGAPRNAVWGHVGMDGSVDVAGKCALKKMSLTIMTQIIKTVELNKFVLASTYMHDKNSPRFLALSIKDALSERKDLIYEGIVDKSYDEVRADYDAAIASGSTTLALAQRYLKESDMNPNMQHHFGKMFKRECIAIARMIDASPDLNGTGDNAVCHTIAHCFNSDDPVCTIFYEFEEMVGHDDGVKERFVKRLRDDDLLSASNRALLTPALTDLMWDRVVHALVMNHELWRLRDSPEAGTSNAKKYLQEVVAKAYASASLVLTKRARKERAEENLALL
jgi:hypothetical protein